MRRILDVDIQEKGRRGWSNMRWRDACERDVTEAGQKEDNRTNRSSLRKKNKRRATPANGTSYLQRRKTQS